MAIPNRNETPQDAFTGPTLFGRLTGAKLVVKTDEYAVLRFPVWFPKVAMEPAIEKLRTEAAFKWPNATPTYSLDAANRMVRIDFPAPAQTNA